jgi:hypothetical protein
LRTLILTSTKGQQDQYVRAFEEAGLADIRGMANYECLLERDSVQVVRGQVAKYTSCEDGPCMSGGHCRLRERGCLYFDAAEQAKAARLVVSNYAYWLADGRREEGLGRFELIVMDEAHDAPEQLAKFLRVELTRQEIEGVLGCDWPGSGSLDAWQPWAQRMSYQVEAELGDYQDKRSLTASERRYVKGLRELHRKLTALSSIKGEWVTETVGDAKVFDPVSPAAYGSLLYQGCPKVVLVGATVREKTAALLGANPIDIGLHEYPSSFDVRRRPIYHIPVPYGGGTVRLNYKASDEELRAVWRAMDRFIEPRFQTRKGIIHTVSYKRRDQIFQGSEFASAMQAHDSRNLAWAIERFKAAPPPAILPSPSISTGIDLPDDQCRWILIPKLPYPDTRSAVMQARVRADPELAPYMVAQELQQMTGRGNRHVGDWCECAIFDDLFRWFISRHYRLFARWWVEALVRLKPGVQPAPLEVEEVPSVRR